jgi:hypothetical protein
MADDKMYEPLYKQAKQQYQQLKLQKLQQQTGGSNQNIDYKKLYKQEKAEYKRRKNLQKN